MASFISGAVGKFSAIRSTFSINTARKAIATLLTQGNGDNFTVPENEREITKSVFISQSNDIFTNLALEDWIYKNYDFSKHHILLLWRNNPCVVIGRHQNPWLEANLEHLSYKGIDVARRNSGGGTVYHDKGNLNLTFFTPRNCYNRKNNLEIIKRSLYREFCLNVDISERDDLLMENYFKVSGTASKLGKSAYHHCTLLVDSQKINLSNSLKKSEDTIETNATRSQPSPVKNLRESFPQVTPERVLSTVGWEFLRTTPLSMQDGGQSYIGRQRGFQLINPTDKWFPGLGKLREDLCSWEWRFGRTPKFTATRTCNSLSDLQLSVKVEGGLIQDLSVASKSDVNFNANELRGQRYTAASLGFLERALADPEPEAQALRALRA